ncbi:hypothetical protein B0H15DRAFT_413119, partial [Mycena belliarum]
DAWRAGSTFCLRNFQIFQNFVLPPGFSRLRLRFMSWSSMLRAFFGAPSRLPPSSHLSPRFYALPALAFAQLALAAKGFGLTLPFTTPLVLGSRNSHTPLATFAHGLDRHAAPLAPPRRHLPVLTLVSALPSTLMVPMLLFHSCPMLPLAHDPHDPVLRRCTPYRMRRLA